MDGNSEFVINFMGLATMFELSLDRGSHDILYLYVTKISRYGNPAANDCWLDIRPDS